MKQRTRERVAFVVFILLVAFAAVVLIGYFATGRSWTVAASIVDDVAGRMDGYTTLVYSGTVEPQVSSGLSERQDSSETDSVSTESDVPLGDETSQNVTDNTAVSGQVRDTDSLEDTNIVGDTGNGDGTINAEMGEDADADDSSSAADSLGLGILSFLPSTSTDEDESVYVSDVRDVYERKGSVVLSLDVGDPGNYLEPQILYAGNKRVGVYSLDYYATSAWLDGFMQYFKEQDVDVVVCITKRADLLATYEGTDVIIVTTEDEGFSTSGRFVDGSFIVCAPERGKVGAVILSTNNVASAKVISTL